MPCLHTPKWGISALSRDVGPWRHSSVVKGKRLNNRSSETPNALPRHVFVGRQLSKPQPIWKCACSSHRFISVRRIVLNTLSKTYYRHYTTQLAIPFNDLTSLYTTEAVVFSLDRFYWVHGAPSHFSLVSLNLFLLFYHFCIFWWSASTLGAPTWFRRSCDLTYKFPVKSQRSSEKQECA